MRGDMSASIGYLQDWRLALEIEWEMDLSDRRTVRMRQRSF